ncbi:VIT domain-containing protein [Hyalangium gracile]|uniref:VIT domain-containing protein n=1 Tax=Hyalangium gracile TaxID=394092 RepID=UPI001CCEEE93|nr:VIT domain-containing protein [Hyalangium gracile]
MNEPSRQPLPVEPPSQPPVKLHTFPAKEEPKWSTFGTACMCLFGIIVPAATLTIELAWAWCASEFFDPVPTHVHSLLVASVPLGNAVALIYSHTRNPRLLRAAILLNGMALAVSTIYSLIFLPFAPLGFIGVIIYGLGLLPLSPHLSFITALVLRRRLKKLHAVHHASPLRPLHGALVALLALSTVEVTGAVTQVALQAATHGTRPETRRAGLQWLRSVGDEETLLASSYLGVKRSSLVAFLLSFDSQISAEDARDTYYRVTGRTFNSVPKPDNLRRGKGFRSSSWDSELGGEHVGGRVPGLSLVSSEMKGAVDGDAALAYLEWTMSFEMTATGQAEARTQVALPPGAVVSRVTLYIDGQEREAAFSSTKQVRAAYQKVVHARRDPLLITQKGKDRIQVQCFPIVKGPPMKIKIGITAPLAPRDEGRFASLPLPTLAERNFHIAEDFRHVVRVESLRPLTTPAGGNLEQRKDGVSEWLAALSDEALVPPQAVLTVQRKGAADIAWAEDMFDPAYVVRQQVRNTVAEVPERVLLILDASAGMKDALPQVAAALSAFPQGTELAVLAAWDGVEELLPLGKADAAALQRAAERVRELSPVGGQDANAALARAWSLAAPQGRTVAVWVHGPQPLGTPRLSGDTTSREYAASRWPTPAPLAELLDVMVGQGPNKMAVDLAPYASFRTVPRLGTLEEDLKNLFSSWGHATPQVHRERMLRAGLELPESAWKTSPHLARLWAREEVSRLIATNEPEPRAQAVQLASRHQLVTEVTGAVVLERQEQYDEAGLKPVDPDSVPSVPEPETWMLLGVACALVIAFRLRRRQA